MRKDHFHGRKSNFSVTALKKSSNPGEINESLHKLRGLVILGVGGGVDEGDSVLWGNRE